MTFLICSCFFLIFLRNFLALGQFDKIAGSIPVEGLNQQRFHVSFFQPNTTIDYKDYKVKLLIQHSGSHKSNWKEFGFEEFLIFSYLSVVIITRPDQHHILIYFPDGPQWQTSRKYLKINVLSDIMMVSIIPECWRYPREMSECLLQTLLLANWLVVTSAEQRAEQTKSYAEYCQRSWVSHSSSAIKQWTHYY